MTASFYSIKQSALALSLEEREQLATDLFDSLSIEAQQQIESAWAKEAESRLNDIAGGNAKTISGLDVSKKIREMLLYLPLLILL